MDNGHLVPFGKYKGQPLAVLAADPGYTEWLLGQAWLPQRYPDIHTIIINNFGESEETPEHNRLQLRFLTSEFRARFLRKVVDWLPGDQLCHSPDFLGFFPPLLPEFEVQGIDVLLQYPACMKNGSMVDLNPPAYYFYSGKGLSLAVECKPVLGDDFPAVLRFLRNIPRHYRLAWGYWFVVLVGACTAESGTWEEVKAFFASANILLLLVDEVDACSPVVFQALDSLQGDPA